MSEHQFEDISLREPEVLDEIEELFREDNFFTRFGAMMRGFAAARDTKDYKTAIQEAQRLWAPACAILIPLVAMTVLFVMAAGQTTRQVEVAVEYITPEELPDLEEPEQPLEQPPMEFTPTDMTMVTDVAMPMITTDFASTVPDAMSAQPAAMDSVLQIKSPIVMRGVVGVTRGAGMRAKMLKTYGGNQQTEEAVMRSLRWLKKKQRADGSWPNNRVAMTGLALLTFLAHGEIPGATSPEFGETVRKAIEYLIRVQNKSSGRLTSSYAHAIATYALCEAYGMTMNPNVKEAADKAINVIINGQNPMGGWQYKLEPSDPSDTSVMGWCAQALKAAHLANAYYDTEALELCMKKTVRGFQGNYKKGGGFGYTGPAAGGLSSVGTLCMQLLGAANSTEVKDTQTLMDSWRPAFTAAQGGHAGNTQYYYYYATQAKFHSGGNRWKSWNEKMWPIYVREQKIEKKAIEDAAGVMQDIGWGENADGSTDRPVMDTCLAALQLMVYYRNLPTTQETAVKTDSGTAASLDSAVDRDDVVVDLGNL